MDKEFYIGQIFNGSYPPMSAVWCNNNDAYIEEIEEEVYEIKNIPEKSKEEKELEIKNIRNSMLTSIEWRVERAKEQKELGIEPVDDYMKLLEYKQYLRDYPKSSEDWYLSNPKTFEEWSK